MDWKEVAAGLKNARLRAGLSQGDLSKALDIAGATVSRFENGERKPDWETLAAWAEACGMEARIELVQPGAAPTDTTPMRFRTIIDRLEKAPEAVVKMVEAMLREAPAELKGATAEPTRGDIEDLLTDLMGAEARLEGTIRGLAEREFRDDDWSAQVGELKRQLDKWTRAWLNDDLPVVEAYRTFSRVRDRMEAKIAEMRPTLIRYPAGLPPRVLAALVDLNREIEALREAGRYDEGAARDAAIFGNEAEKLTALLRAGGLGGLGGNEEGAVSALSALRARVRKALRATLVREGLQHDESPARPALAPVIPPPRSLLTREEHDAFDRVNERLSEIAEEVEIVRGTLPRIAIASEYGEDIDLVDQARDTIDRLANHAETAHQLKKPWAVAGLVKQAAAAVDQLRAQLDRELTEHGLGPPKADDDIPF